MSLNVSTELEARIVAKARQLGLPVADFLELVVDENEAFSASVHQAEATLDPLAGAEIQEKINRGLAQLEDGDFVDGEQFMGALLSAIDERREG
jgi:hypothetical protein